MDKPVYDLERLADALEETSRHEPVSQAIRRAYAVASAVTDLVRAEHHLQLLGKLQTRGGMPEQLSHDEGSSLIESLFVNSIILYARATVTTPLARDRWFGEGKLNKEERLIHKTAIQLRDKEIAHFGKGLDVAGEPLLAELLYLDRGSDSPINFRVNSWATRPEFVFDLHKLVTRVLGLGRDGMDHWFREVAVRIKRATSFDTSLWSLIYNFEATDPRLLMMAEGNQIVDGKRVTSRWTQVSTRNVSRPNVAGGAEETEIPPSSE